MDATIATTCKQSNSICGSLMYCLLYCCKLVVMPIVCWTVEWFVNEINSNNNNAVEHILAIRHAILRKRDIETWIEFGSGDGAYYELKQIEATCIRRRCLPIIKLVAWVFYCFFFLVCKHIAMVASVCVCVGAFGHWPSRFICANMHIYTNKHICITTPVGG